ncbi:MAG: translation elongation factor Ts [Proteobacteria bacterium]|nr:translation elongation factor Ts [Pseudomonadota bacterium]
MSEISAGQVKTLREMTGLGMMECKKALTEVGGDLKKAEELLRIKSGAKASKAASRVAADGVIGAWVSPEGKLGALVELNCETDFVAKNEDFLAFAGQLAERVALDAPADVDTLGGLALGGSTVEDMRQKLLQRIGENISIRRFHRVESQVRLALYVHGHRIGVLVEYDGADDAAKDVAMHVAFAKPQHLSKSEVPADVVSRERDILTARAQESGKPAEIVAKMVEGGIQKFLGEMSLLGQPFVKDDKLTVEKMLAARKTKVLGFVFVVVGEGIERKANDFAAEVMAQAGLSH